jgi:hypothetical protein
MHRIKHLASTISILLYPIQSRLYSLVIGRGNTQRDRPPPQSGAPPTGEVSVGHKASRPQTVQGRSGGTSQQDGARCLGGAGHRDSRDADCDARNRGITNITK